MLKEKLHAAINPINSSVATDFGKLVKSLILSRFKSYRAFIRAAEGERRVNSGQGYLSKVIAGTRPPPFDRLDAWADALELEGREREHFWDLATIASLDERVRGRFEKILTRVEATERHQRK